jgi:hypothetical protein
MLYNRTVKQSPRTLGYVAYLSIEIEVKNSYIENWCGQMQPHSCENYLIRIDSSI